MKIRKKAQNRKRITARRAHLWIKYRWAGHSHTPGILKGPHHAGTHCPMPAYYAPGGLRCTFAGGDIPSWSCVPSPILLDL